MYTHTIATIDINMFIDININISVKHYLLGKKRKLMKLGTRVKLGTPTLHTQKMYYYMCTLKY